MGRRGKRRDGDREEEEAVIKDCFAMMLEGKEKSGGVPRGDDEEEKERSSLSPVLQELGYHVVHEIIDIWTFL